MTRRFAVVFALVFALLATTATEADASTSYLSKTKGRTAEAYWTQYDNTAPGSGPFGNVHIGWLSVYETSNGVGDAFLYIDDFDCEPGQQPWGGHHGEAGCAYLGSRFGDGSGLSFALDKSLTAARVTGQVTIYGGGFHGEGGGVVGSPMIDVTWTGQGSLSRSMSNYRYTDGDGTVYSDRYRGETRQAVLGGSIGAMTFDADHSGGSMSTFSSRSSSRTR